MKMITRQVGFIPGPVNVGVIRSGEKALLIDTGLDDASAKRILSAAREAGTVLTGILNTHAHADHYGGNARIKKASKDLSFIYAPPIEEALIRYPVMEPVYLFGANPIAQLKGKFLMGKPSPAEPLPSPRLRFEELTIQAITLPGHSINQMGYLCDHVFFCADTLFPPAIIEKYGLLYCFDVAAQFKTLHSLKKTAESVRMVVPSHATPRQDITPLVDVNLRHMEEIAEIIFSLTTVSRSSEEITKRLCDQRNIPLRSIWQYHLHLNTVKAYLSAHLKENRVSVFLEENTLIWVRK